MKNWYTNRGEKTDFLVSGIGIIEDLYRKKENRIWFKYNKIKF